MTTDENEILKGTRVKITAGEFAGKYGTVERTPIGDTEGHTRLYVRTDGGVLILIPTTNVERVQY